MAGHLERSGSEAEAQRMRALAEANAVRAARARLKRQLANGTLSIIGILAQPPAFTRTQKVRQLLVSLPPVGPVRANRILSRCRIPETKTVAALTDRQREALIKQFAHPNRGSHPPMGQSND
jgi:hypothetical protein